MNAAEEGREYHSSTPQHLQSLGSAIAPEVVQKRQSPVAYRPYIAGMAWNEAPSVSWVWLEAIKVFSQYDRIRLAIFNSRQ